MPKVKTSELIDLTLDWAVAKCKGIDPPYGWNAVKGQKECLPFSTSWGLGGPIIERELIDVLHVRQNDLSVAWDATFGNDEWVMTGPTMLIAGMRCFVASKLGDEVEVPEELLS